MTLERKRPARSGEEEGRDGLAQGQGKAMRIQAFTLRANANRKWSKPKALKLDLEGARGAAPKDLMRTLSVLSGGGCKAPLERIRDGRRNT